jgi:CDI immunity proteins
MSDLGSTTMTPDDTSIADLVGPWADSDSDSGLIQRCKSAWNKPLRDLTRQELATLLRQHIAVEHLLLIARERVAQGVDDDSEIYEGELQSAIDYVENRP